MNTWKDYINKSNLTTTNTNNHNFVLIKKVGGKILKVRRVDDYQAEVVKSPTIKYYKCSKCGITGIMRENNKLTLDDKTLENVDCEDVLIYSIL